MGEETTSLGSIHIAPNAVATIAYHATLDGDNVDIEIYIVVEYGTRIAAVANSVANTVRYHVEKALGLRVTNINVHVAGLRVSDTD